MILDWAGTTVDFGCMAPPTVLHEVFDSEGVPLVREEARHAMGLPKRDQIRAIAQLPRVADAWATLHGSKPGEAEVDRLYARFLPAQMECLERFSTVIPGVPAAVDQMRRQGLKIGSTTGYTREMLDRILPVAREGGYEPDSHVTPGEAAGGRPSPWMCFVNLQRMGVYPPAACVKIGDTESDIEEGLNAGMWTIGITLTGNEVGLSEQEVAALPAAEVKERRKNAYAVLAGAGAHYVANSVAEAMPFLKEIEARLLAGDRP